MRGIETTKPYHSFPRAAIEALVTVQPHRRRRLRGDCGYRDTVASFQPNIGGV